MFVRSALAISLATALVVWTCSMSATPAASANVPPSQASAVTVPPGQIDRAAASLDRLASDLLRTTGVPGMAIAVVHDDVVIFAKGFGIRKVHTSDKVDENTVFQLASVSKPIGATVVAGVVGRGLVRWSDPVSRYIPGFALSDTYAGTHVTIADMYAHRSGLPDHAGDLLEDLGYDRATILARLSLEPLDPFRVSYHYTNFGITAGAQAVANAAGTTWENLSRQVLYGPLGMTSTSSRFADYDSASNKAVLHVRVGGRWEARFTRDPDAQSPAGGVSSSASDVAKWLRLMLANGKYGGKQIVDKEALLEARTPAMLSAPLATPESRASFYGLGVGVGYDEAGRLRLSHSGAFALGAATAIAMLPSEKLGIVVLTNGMAIGVPETLVAEFFDLVLFGKVQRDWFAGYSKLFAALAINPSELAGKKPPLLRARAQPGSAYRGIYTNAFYGTASIKYDGGRLVMLLGPRHEAFPLTHWDANTFSYFPRGENAVGISAVTFTMRNDGRAATFVVENLNAERLGTFSRI